MKSVALKAQTELLENLPDAFDVGIHSVSADRFVLVIKHASLLKPRYIRNWPENELKYKQFNFDVVTNVNAKQSRLDTLADVIHNLKLTVKAPACVKWLKANGFVKSSGAWERTVTHKSMTGAVEIGLNSNQFYSQPLLRRGDDGAWCGASTFDSLSTLKQAVAYEEERVKAILDEIDKTPYSPTTIPRNGIFDIVRNVIKDKVEHKVFTTNV